MRIALAVAALAAVAGSALGQISPEEAYQKLAEKQKQRQAQQPPAATQPSAPTSRSSPMAQGRTMHQAWQDLLAHRFAQAAESFDRILKSDPKDATALEGRAICRYEIGQYKPATRDADAALELAGKRGAKPARQTTVVAVVTSIMADNPMRAVKLLRAVMEPLEQDGKLDEELQNMLGTALWRADAQARRQPYFQESMKYYLSYDQKLAKQKNNGTARWGMHWVPAAEAQRNWNAYGSAVANVDRASTRYDQAALAEQHARDNWVELNGMRLFSTADRRRYTNEYKQSIVTEHAAQADLNRARDRLRYVKRPEFPDKLEPDWQEPR